MNHFVWLLSAQRTIKQSLQAVESVLQGNTVNYTRTIKTVIASGLYRDLLSELFLQGSKEETGARVEWEPTLQR